MVRYEDSKSLKAGKHVHFISSRELGTYEKVEGLYVECKNYEETLGSLGEESE